MNTSRRAQFRAATAVPRALRLVVALVAAAAVAACAFDPTSEPIEPEGPLRKEMVWAVTDAAELIRINAGQPRQVLERKPLLGLPAGEHLVGIDFRVSRGVLYALSSGGRLYTLATASGQLERVGHAPAAALSGRRFGFDFNPVADRIRVVSDNGMNLRLHPETGAVAAADPALHPNEGTRVAALAGGAGSAGGATAASSITAAAYTYNQRNDKLTTNYAIDIAAGTLVMQGSREGDMPVVSPNTGRITPVGALGTGAIGDAAFDIADIDNTALAALRQRGRTRLHLIDLQSGRAVLLGTVGTGRALWGMAIEP